MAVVFIPPLMQGLTEGDVMVLVQGTTLRQVVNNLGTLYPGLKERLLDGDDLSPGIAVSVDGEFTRLGLLQPVREDSEVHFLPAISGG